ncbi:hypothetical protein OOK39_45170 [Streptomyces sp. NBC_00264]|uniref:hypothetical protein n=1 Tax=unclassified Streptomyces TaxID=2593676 RepID=UPI00224FCA47|nr:MULTISPECIES: hypothetical protein [unclassified Streptomyces]MCX5166230.1 hypothetical protein [Streptomyces sp. NBC_00305]MCX5224747.1 hypothetical protein [Streptomyces sp. NBC_00264]
MLLACLPALCLPELADLPNLQVTARRTLHHIAHRVHNNPRLVDLAADQLHAAADALVTRGQLLSLPDKQEGDHEFDGRVLRLAEDLALLSANPDHLAGVCTQLARLDQPAVVALKILLDHCGRSANRWEALAAAMTFDYDEDKSTFGQLLDSLDHTPARARTP